MLSSLPYKRCDEVCTVLQSANSVIARRGAFVLSAMKTTVDASPPAELAAEPEARHSAQNEVTPDADSTDQQVQGCCLQRRLIVLTRNVLS